MIAITSIAPGHKNYENQFQAIQSWKDEGYKVVSVNAPEEIGVLKDLFDGVTFVPTLRHNKKIFGKPYVIVSALIDYLKEIGSEYSLIINSDIIIGQPGNTGKIKQLSESGIVIMNRRDFISDMGDSSIYKLGFDGFFINKKYLDIFPQTILCLGQCFWDYWVPYSAISSGVKVHRFTEPYLYHKKHNIQYSLADWRKTGEIFRGESGLVKFRRVEDFSKFIYTTITKNS